MPQPMGDIAMTSEKTVFEFAEDGRGRCVVRFSGEFDMAAEAAFDQMLAGVLANGRQEVLFDLRPLEFIDSTGIRALLRADGQAKNAGIRLYLAPGAKVDRLLDLVGVSTMFERAEPE